MNRSRFGSCRNCGASTTWGWFCVDCVRAGAVSAIGSALAVVAARLLAVWAR